MRDGLLLFESLVRSRFFTNITIDLCFTKMDIFEQKVALGAIPQKTYMETGVQSPPFEEYEGAPRDKAAVQAYITRAFQNVLPKDRPVRIHYMDATNTNQIRNVLANIIDGRTPSPQLHLPTADHKRKDSASVMMYVFCVLHLSLPGAYTDADYSIRG